MESPERIIKASDEEKEGTQKEKAPRATNFHIGDLLQTRVRVASLQAHADTTVIPLKLTVNGKHSDEPTSRCPKLAWSNGFTNSSI